jgi:heme/copper-type cytochrome/quinol oxidase subunit 2
MIANRLYGMIIAIAIAIAIAISIIVIHLFVFVVVQKKEEVNNSKEFCAQRFLENQLRDSPSIRLSLCSGIHVCIVLELSFRSTSVELAIDQLTVSAHKSKTTLCHLICFISNTAFKPS